MSHAIYQDRILRLAEAGDSGGRVEAPDATLTLDNPLCGDRVTLELRRDETGRVADLGHRVRGCVLCRASAAILGAHAGGHDARAVAAVRARLQALLRDGDALQAGAAWADLAVFEPVAPHRSRHECVLLPFDALLQALRAADG